MFTGIIQSVGKIRKAVRKADGMAFSIESADIVGDLSLGDSICINGVCQTVEDISGGVFSITAVGETLRRTTLAGLAPGESVNLERALTLDTPLGGHLVQGHVDGIGSVQSFVRSGSDRVLSVKLPGGLGDFIVPKGSIAIDGVSLTVMGRKPGGVITVTVVPFTLQNTIIGDYRPGRRVNIEADIIGKYVVSYLSKSFIKDKG